MRKMLRDGHDRLPAAAELAHSRPDLESWPISLDAGALRLRSGDLSRRETMVLRAFFMLPAALREQIFFRVRPWSMPLQVLLNRCRGGAHSVRVLFAAGPLAQFQFRAVTGEKYFLLGPAYERQNWRIFQSLIRPGDVAYDIGAHAGFWALGLAGLVGARGRVVAIEPSPQNFMRLRENVLLNCGPRRGGAATLAASFGVDASSPGGIILLNVALGDRAGWIDLVEAGTRTHLAAPSAGRAESGSGAPVQVPMVRLDDLVFKQRQPPPSFLLLDVEGAAGRVLAGAARVLSRFRPGVICEIHDAAECAQAAAALARHHYRFTRIGRGARTPVHYLAQPV